MDIENFKCNIVMPMSGFGKRYAEEGFVIPKPFIDIGGELMFKIAFDSVGFLGENNIFIINNDHLKFRDINGFISRNIENSHIIIEDSIAGQAFSSLRAENIIDNDTPLFICNCDHKIFFDKEDFINRINITNCDGIIITFYTNDPVPKYSYAKFNENGDGIEIAEKIKISDFATAGIYFFKKGSDFVKYCKQMINNKKSVNNEYYVAPIYNEMIADGKKIVNMLCNNMTSFGTPDDLKRHLLA